MTNNHRQPDDAGAALILAIVFVFAIGLVLAAIAQFATGAATGTYNLREIRSSEIAAENLVTNEIPLVRANPTLCSTAGNNIFPTLFCTQVTAPFTATTRTVDFYACPADTLTSPCTKTGPGLVLHATALFNDVPGSDPLSSKCSGSATQTCGIQVAIQTWDVHTADN